MPVTHPVDANTADDLDSGQSKAKRCTYVLGVKEGIEI